MKKLIFAAFAAGAMVLAGCTKVEVKDVPENRAIGFDNFVSNSVKSIDNIEDLTNFYVWGGHADVTTLFQNTEVTKAEGTWTYSPKRMWEESKVYKFAAYSNDNAILGTEDAANTGVVDFDYASGQLTFTDYDASAGTNDFVYGISTNESYTGAASSNTTVDFTFYHALSKVAFSFTKDASLDDIKIEIIDLQITSINTKADFTGNRALNTDQLAYTTWSDWKDAKSQIVKFAENGNVLNDNAGTAASSTALYLIPQTANAIGITFTLNTSTESNITTGLPATKNFKVTLPATSTTSDVACWFPGYSYIYSAEIKAATFDVETIEFTVTDVHGFTEDNVTIEDDVIISND